MFFVHVGHHQGGPVAKEYVNGTCQERYSYVVYRQYYVPEFHFR